MAVGDLGTIVTSTDGVNWLQRQSGTQQNLSSVAYGNVQLVAVSIVHIGSIIITSSDGVSWLPQGKNWGFEAVGYANGQFVGVFWDQYGIGEYFFQTSSDGVNWVSHPLPLRNYLSSISDTTYGNGHFVAVGRYGTILQSGSIITLSITPNADTRRLTLSLEGPTGLGYTIQSSTDLMSWLSVTNITTTQPGSVILDVLPADSARVFYRAYSQ